MPSPASRPTTTTITPTTLYPTQVNVVVMRGINDDELADFVGLTRHDPINVRFIEYMPFDGNAWGSNKMVPYRELMAAVNDRWVEAQVEVCGGCRSCAGSEHTN
jgi:molybdenum cofactor biosynthesis enzyme MoaA